MHEWRCSTTAINTQKNAHTHSENEPFRIGKAVGAVDANGKASTQNLTTVCGL